ncbi:MAG: hypothetical protein JRE47_11340 [Deltaproteobacteria bacterium]|nr:hypothetical protein [Deltaproteobacteria bacterium]
MNDKFPVLSFLSILLRIGGWLLVIVGLYFAVYEGIIEPNQPGHRFDSGDQMQLITGFIQVISGICVVAFGEIIGVLFAIELNTR